MSKSPEQQDTLEIVVSDEAKHIQGAIDDYLYFEDRYQINLRESFYEKSMDEARELRNISRIELSELSESLMHDRKSLMIKSSHQPLVVYTTEHGYPVRVRELTKDEIFFGSVFVGTDELGATLRIYDQSGSEFVMLLRGVIISEVSVVGTESIQDPTD